MTATDEAKLRRRTAAVLLALCVYAIVVFGLWPFGRPGNRVVWLRDRHAVRFGQVGNILSAAALGPGSGACTIEMWLRPRRADGSGTLISFYNAKSPTGLSLHQSESDLRLDLETGGWRRARYYVGGVFRPGSEVFLSVISDLAGTQVYLDGRLVRQLTAVGPAKDICSGRFVVGDSPVQNNTWQGELAGLAIDQAGLTADEIAADHERWMHTGSPTTCKRRVADALYLFSENEGGRVPDHGKSRVDLTIPERYTIPRQMLLETPWSAFEPTSSYVTDIFINIAGFIPFGVALGALLSASLTGRRVGTVTALAGFLVSLTIEVLQSRLPTRHSDFTDVLTNTIGAAIGVALYKRNHGLVNGLIRALPPPRFLKRATIR